MTTMAEMAAKEMARFKRENGSDGQQFGVKQRPQFATKFSRAHDEAILDWLTRQDAGETLQSIADDYGVGRGTVSRSCANVRKEMGA